MARSLDGISPHEKTELTVMKRVKFLCAAWLALLTLTARPQETATVGIAAPVVDRRVELMTIVARLADFPEYQSSLVRAYTDSLDAWFAPYRNHAAVASLRELREQRGVAYDAVPIMGVYLSEPPRLRARFPLTATQPDERWGVKSGKKFIRLLRRFYRDTRCEAFFERQDTLFATVERSFQPVFSEIDMAWFGRFFGVQHPDGMVPIIGMGFGGGNYGGRILYPDSTADNYAFMGSWSLWEGQPMFDAELFKQTIVHEFCHSFVNPTLEHDTLALCAAEGLYRAEAERMDRQAYTDGRSVLYETFVRAAVICYLREHATRVAAENELWAQIDLGFVWMPEAVALLEAYATRRDRYPDFAAFVPRVRSWCQETVGSMEALHARRAAEREVRREQALKVVAVEPFGNGAQEVDPALTELTIRFDRPLVGRGYAFNAHPDSEEALPVYGRARYSEDKRAVTVSVRLKPGRTYRFWVLKDLSFVGADGVRMYEDYLVTFRTRDK